MDASSGFASVSISSSKDFSWVFFADWFLTYFLVIGLLFHFNRAVAFVLTHLLDVFLWRTRRIKLDLQSIKFSPLGGRVFFRNLTYVDKDQTVTVVQGTLTWRYWLFAVRKNEKDLLDENTEADVEENAKLPSRWMLQLSGLEVFMYNRTVSYDNLMEQLAPEGEHQDEKLRDADLFKSTSESSSRTSAEVNEGITDPGKSMFSCLPLHVKVNKGAIVAGNKTTHAVLIASFDSADGVVETQRAGNALDHGRQSFKFDFEKLNVSAKPNIMYQEAEKKAQNSQQPPNAVSKKSRFNRRRWLPVKPFLKLWRLRHRKSNLSVAHSQWKGLSQYLHNDSGSISEGQHNEQEYGKYTTLLTADNCCIDYYYDCPGTVPVVAAPTNPLDGIDIGNSGPAPKFGIDVKLSNSTTHYGPWAERQRSSLHQLFLPTICRDAVAQKKLTPGSQRLYTKVDFNLAVVDDMIVRVPMREHTKNEEFIERNKDFPDALRPFGWLELKVGRDSTVSITMAQVASNAGFSNRLDATLQSLEVRSSVNHDILLRCKEHVLSADLGYPLSWDGYVAWSFLNESREIDVFLLREHVTLISDMFTDFAAGPSTPYERFRPFAYDFFWKCNGYKMYFNINDANIVNNPLDFNDNIYMSLQGDDISIKFHIPMDGIIRTSTTVDYTIHTPGFSLVIETPPWHTLNNFLANKEVGRSGDFTVDGSYTYYSEIGLDLVDTVIIACRGKNVGLECYGFVVKYIMSIKENYFGDFTKFKTLEEYTNHLGADGASIAAPDDGQYHEEGPKSVKHLENETDVHFSFCVENSSIILPSNIYDCESNMALYFEALDIDIRFTNYYMDMQVDMTPAKGYFSSASTNDQVLDVRGFVPPSRHDLLLDGLRIHGHRVFGLPPVEPTCFCKWDISPGDLIFDGPTVALSGFVKSLVRLGFGYKNLENHLLLEEPELFDTTSLTVDLPKLSFTLRDVGVSHVVNLQLIDVLFTFIDFTNPRYIQKISLGVGEALASVQSDPGDEILFEFATSVEVSNFCQSKDFEVVRQKQNNHILEHDGPFHRLAFFVDDSLKAEYNGLYGSISPSFSLPDVAPPLRDESIDAIFDDLGLSDRDDLVDASDPASSKDDFFQDFDSDSSIPLRPASKSKRLRDTISGINTKPVLDYDDTDFRPLHEADPAFETDNFVLNFGELNVAACSQSLPLLLDVVDKFLRGSLKSTLDDLQVTVLKKLFTMFNKDPVCMNLRFVSPHLSVVFTETPWSTKSPVDTSNTDHIHCVVENPSFASCFKETTREVSSTVLALHVLSLKLTLKQSSSASTPLSVSLDDLEVWSDSSTTEASSVSVRSVDVSLESESSEWLAVYIQRIVGIVVIFCTSLESVLKRHELSKAEFLYQVALASNEFRIEHDPAVITRPAYIIRLSRQHIRANDSWKVIARLRHILQNLPPEWVSAQEEKFAVDNFTAPPTAMEDVISVFSTWRSWEFTDIEHSFVFRYVFSFVKPSVALDLSLFEIGVVESSLTVICPEGNNYVCLSFVEFSSNQKSESNPDADDISPVVGTSFKVSRLKGQIGPQLLSLFPLSRVKLPLTGSRSSTPALSLPTLHIAGLVEDFDLKLSLGAVSLSIGSSDVTCSALVVQGSPFPELNIAYGARYFELDISSSNHSVLSYSVSDFSASVSSVGPLLTGPKSVEVSSENTSVRMDCETEAYLQLLSDIAQDIDSLVPALDQILPKANKAIISPTPSFTESRSHLTLPPLDFVIKNKSIDWKLAIVDPLAVSGIMENVQFEVISSGSLLFANVKSVNLSQSITLRGSSGSTEVMKGVHSGFSCFAKYSLESGLVDLSVNYERTRFFVPNLLSRVKIIRSAVDIVNSSIQSLIEYSKKIKLPERQEKASAVTLDTGLRVIVNKVSFKGDMFAFEVELASDIYTLQLNGISLDGYDVTSSTKKAHGDLSIKNLKVSVKGDLVPRSASVLMELNVGVKVVTNELATEQSLQVESEYFRIMLHPATVVRLTQLSNDVSYLAGFFADIDLDLATSAGSTHQSVSEPLFNFTSVHMLSYGFCAGFIFDTPTDKFPGIIGGCEKMFFIAEENIGKFSLISAFVSMANGTNHESFYSLGNEVHSPNRSFLPNVQITYAIKKIGSNKDVQIRVTGEELDVKFLSSSVSSVEKLLKSVSSIDSLKKNLRVYPQKHPIPNNAATSEYRLPSDLTSISCLMNFDGGVVKLYRWEDFHATDSMLAPSFELKAPAVRVVTEYSKTSGIKDHNVNVEVFTYSSSNVLHSTCVPVLYDLWYGMKELGEVFSSNDSSKKWDASTTASPNPIRLLSNFHINFALHIDRQELSLSCEPSAKVQAVVGIGGIGIRLNTNDSEGTQGLSGIVDLRSLGASLQHSYSREVSGSVGLDHLLITLLLADSDTGTNKMHIAGQMAKIKSYINLKQMQDLDLFRDLWFPNSTIVDNSANSLRSSVSSIDTQDDNIVLKYQKASSTSPIAWTVDFLVSDVSCEVDLGQSLGVLSLELDQGWAASRKKSRREQDLLIGFNSIALRSRGRFSGHLVVKDIRIHSVIQWSMVGDSYQMPLVLLSTGFESIDVKASFDYNVFLLGRIQEMYITVFNQVDSNEVLQDKLVASVRCASSEMYVTTFAAANIMDIYNTLARIRQDTKMSYKQDLKKSIAMENPKKSLDIIDMIATLRTELEVGFGRFLLHVYPGSLLDSQVLVVDLGGMSVSFSQNFVNNRLTSNVDLRLMDISLSLSSYRTQLPEESLSTITIEEFVLHSMNAKGGGIFFFPSWECAMEATSVPNSSIIEYRYKSLFTGKVDIRWNLGSINFIREMWTIHARAFAARLQKNPSSDELPLFGDENIEEKIKEVEMSDKFVYVPLQPPVIDAPQLRDLGDATPPLEWFGLHRQSFPNLTHQYVIVGLQKLVHEVEMQYGRVLGKATG